MTNGAEHYEDPNNCVPVLEGIAQTGFPLEHSVVELLRAHQWNVISNRYYIDDVQPAVREIDLVAYKVSNVHDFSVVTTLLVSCKKSAANAWALLSRDVDEGDPNIDWRPIHVWSSCVESEYMLRETPWTEHYVWAVSRSGARKLVAIPDARVFAFQEMSHPAGRPQNDRAVFQSVTSLLKALGYELGALPDRIRDRRIYQFSLLSVVDAPALLRLHFSGEDVAVRPRTDDVYLADYIVNRERLAARIHFVLFSGLAEAISQYDALHTMNRQFFANEYDYFYRNVLSHWKARRLLMKRFQNQIGFHVKYALPEASRSAFDSQKLDAFFDEANKRVQIEGGFSAAEVAALNGKSALTPNIEEALKDVFHYKGPFLVAEDSVPF